MKRLIFLFLIIAAMLGLTVSSSLAQETVQLTFSSFRTDDIDAWENILAIFEDQHPTIDIVYEPINNEEYNTAIAAALDAGVGPDLVACRTFDLSLSLYTSGGLAEITDLSGIMDNFTGLARTSWSTDDGSEIFCVPMAAAIHGFIYNADIFAELGLEEPQTESEFFAVLDAIAAGRPDVAPMGLTTLTTWPATIVGWDSLWPSFTDGEATRQALMAGDLDVLTSPDMLAAVESLGRWRDYLPEGYQSLAYTDMQQLFTLGLTAVYPAGSWEIPLFNEQAEFELGAFKPYVPDGRDPEDCTIINRSDIGVGMNANTDHPEEARIFLEWLTTAEFAQAHQDNLPGFFTMSVHPVEINDPLAAEFGAWRDICGSTELLMAQFLSRGEPSGLQLMIDNAALLINGEMTAEEVVQTVYDGLASWYEPPILLTEDE
jgi:raffinose/stachyose/melibiose transport system substrate-binding protein